MKMRRGSVLLASVVLVAILPSCGDQQETQKVRSVGSARPNGTARADRSDTFNEVRPHLAAWMESVRYFKQATSRGKQMNQTKRRTGRIFSSEDMEKIRSLLRKAIAAGNTADPEKLNKMYPAFGDHFRDEMLPGMKGILEGIGRAPTDEIRRAAAPIQRWNTWYSAHSKRIDKRLLELGFEVVPE